VGVTYGNGSRTIRRIRPGKMSRKTGKEASEEGGYGWSKGLVSPVLGMLQAIHGMESITVYAATRN